MGADNDDDFCPADSPPDCGSLRATQTADDETRLRGSRTTKRHFSSAGATDHEINNKLARQADEIYKMTRSTDDEIYVPARARVIWERQLREWYPNLHGQTYCVPPVYINKVQHKETTIAGNSVLIPQEPVGDMPRQQVAKKDSHKGVQQSQVRNDNTHQGVLKCVETIAEMKNEVMLVVSQLKFKDYLGDTKLPFPRPADSLDKDKRRGDFDLLLVNKGYGLLVGEIKAVGDVHCESQEKGQDILADKVQQAVKQLDKAGDMLHHLTSDFSQPTPRMTKVLMLPNVSRELVRDAVTRHPQILQEMRHCLGVPDDEDPTDVIMCSDEKNDVGQLMSWWKRLTSRIGSDGAMTDDVYEELVARFGGPATPITVSCDGKSRRQLHTVGDGVSETGALFSQRRLVPEQQEVLERNEPCVFVSGPPGTGKTLVLLLQASKWLRDSPESPVHVVSTWSGSMAATYFIQHQLVSAGHNQNLVRLHFFELMTTDEVDAAFEALVGGRLNETDSLRVIADEAFCGSQFQELCAKLHNNCSLSLWGASVYHGFRPACLTPVTFTVPLRTPPVVTEEIKRSAIITDGFVHAYTRSSLQDPCQGPKPWQVRHRGEGHGSELAVQCGLCGQELGRILRELLVESQAHADDAGASRPAPLSYRDIFLLTTTYELVPEQKDAEGDVTEQASGLLKGLSREGVPVRVVAWGEHEALREVAVGEGGDVVIAADADSVRGLERKVVVWVPYYESGDTPDEEDFARLDALSRTTAQLVWIV